MTDIIEQLLHNYYETVNINNKKFVLYNKLLDDKYKLKF